MSDLIDRSELALVLVKAVAVEGDGGKRLLRQEAKRIPGVVALPLCIGLLVLGCQEAQEHSAAPATVRAESRGAPGDADRPDEAPPTITPDGIGAAQVGFTLAEVRLNLPAGSHLAEVDPRFMVDLDAVPVISGPDTLYYLGVPAGETLTDASPIRFAITLHEQVRTSEGIGPGVTLQDAVRQCGRATLRYSVHDEMREYVSFANCGHRRVTFRVAPTDDSLLAGRYTSDGEYNETDEYDGSARIGMVMVDLGPIFETTRQPG